MEPEDRVGKGGVELGGSRGVRGLLFRGGHN